MSDHTKTLQVGDAAPDFSLPSKSGQISLQPYRGKKSVVLLFYPLAWTPV